jgi:hypothetical protein
MQRCHVQFYFGANIYFFKSSALKIGSVWYQLRGRRPSFAGHILQLGHKSGNLKGDSIKKLYKHLCVASSNSGEVVFCTTMPSITNVRQLAHWFRHWAWIFGHCLA